jgi:RNase H-fold protein (predicted Holliday junction resolvase)
MDIIKALENAKEAVNKMKEHLKTRPDEKLIKGYKLAMTDYERTGNEQCKMAANTIKEEIDRRGLDIE